MLCCQCSTSADSGGGEVYLLNDNGCYFIVCLIKEGQKKIKNFLLGVKKVMKSVEKRSVIKLGGKNISIISRQTMDKMKFISICIINIILCCMILIPDHMVAGGRLLLYAGNRRGKPW